MGGRGGGSGRGSSALDTKDVGELRQYMQDHYSVTVHSLIRSISAFCARQLVSLKDC